MGDESFEWKIRLQKQIIKDLRGRIEGLRLRENRCIEECSRFRTKIRDLGQIIDDEREACLPDRSPWTAEDGEIRKTYPGWRYLEPFQNIIKKIQAKYPGLDCVISESVKVEVNKWSIL